MAFLLYTGRTTAGIYGRVRLANDARNVLLWLGLQLCVLLWLAQQLLGLQLLGLQL